MKDPSVNPGNVGFTNFWLTSFDYNLDGYEDLFVGGFFIYNGSATFDTIPEFHLIWPDSSFNAYAGANLFNAGDINKDGYPDLAIGMPNMFGSNGLVHIRLGGNSGFDENYIIMEPDPPVTSRFGSGIINIGDLDGNGVSDVLIGAPFYTTGRGWGKLHYYSGDSTLISSTLGIQQINSEIPNSFQLNQNYPNPFNPTTTIEFHLSNSARVRLEIFNTLGQRIRELVNGFRIAGVYQITWDGTSDNGQSVASGIYLYRLQVGDFTQCQKMLLIH
ncbi:MAG: T9SS C-terminal target domain-containing protein [Calditrichaeota bacterium]|nr:MAG: T9SS C-terminal target domain-containing protein [Calditrichota bacterium]